MLSLFLYVVEKNTLLLTFFQNMSTLNVIGTFASFNINIGRSESFMLPMKLKDGIFR